MCLLFDELLANLFATRELLLRIHSAVYISLQFSGKQILRLLHNLFVCLTAVQNQRTVFLFVTNLKYLLYLPFPKVAQYARNRVMKKTEHECNCLPITNSEV